MSFKDIMYFNSNILPWKRSWEGSSWLSLNAQTLGTEEVGRLIIFFEFFIIAMGARRHGDRLMVSR